MTASATSHAFNERPNTTRARDRPSPLVLALDRLFPKRGTAPYAPLERLVALVIVRAMSPDSNTGDWNCFLSYPTIARWTGTSVASVKRMLQKHGDGPAPLFFRTRSGQTRGHRHQCYRFTWVWHPEPFAAARDAARAERTKDVQHALRDLQPERLALQRQLVDFGGTLTETDYLRRLKALEMAVRQKTPARAALKSRGSS
jgi:hypothetical protein